jgi:predicted dienelactone hydrolase
MIYKVILALTLVMSLVGSLAAQDAVDLPLAAPGPYVVSTTTLLLDSDQSRDTLEFRTGVWYPAVDTIAGADPDLSDAPYPLIVYSHGLGSSYYDIPEITAHLASHGFVVAGTFHQDDPDQFFTDRPLDIQHVVEQLAILANDGKAPPVDTEQLGILGVSLGGMTALQMGGMHMDWPATQESACAAAHFAPSLCLTEEYRETVLALWEQYGTQDENGLWYIPTDLNIRAIAAAAPCCVRLFGERGLATADVPLLLLHGTADAADSDYEEEGVYAYEHYGSEDRALVSFIDGDHYFGIRDPHKPRFKHLLAAFFGYYLQGREDYAEYLTEDYVNSIEGLVWGHYEDE